MTSPSMQVSLTIGCSNLPKADLMSRSDPYCQLYTRDLNSSFVNANWKCIGRTETLRNTSNPVFVHHFDVEYKFEQEQTFMVRVFDDDFGQSQDDFLGECTFKLGTVMGSRGQVAMFPLLNGHVPTLIKQPPRVTLRAQPVEDCGNNADVLHLTLSGHAFDRKDGFFGKADPYFEFSVQRANGEFVVVHRSEYVKQNLNPKWQPCSIPMQRLQSSSGMLRLTVTDWDADGKHDLIGVADVSVADLLQLRKNIPMVHPPTKSKYTKASYSNSGYVDVVQCWVEKKYSFLQYLRGGLQMNLMLAVDFTASNGDPNKPGTLHYGAGRIPNSYTEALTAVGNILLEYDSDKMVQAFGFGAKPSQWEQQVSHCFPLAGTGQSEHVHGIDGALQAYTNCFERGIVLFGPTNFAPVVQHCTTAARCNPNSYSVLLIVTDGAITDMQQTIDAIVFAAANAPISIIIVGVGAADFSSMEQLDGDYQPVISSRGERCCRDIVQFVPFNKFRGNGAQLASETLKEIPGQVQDYFSAKRIAPNAPIELPLASIVEPPPPPPPVARPLPVQTSASYGKTLFLNAMHHV